MGSDIWSPLEAEFAAWRKGEMSFPFWWRDDDAVQVTPQLDRLLDLSRDVNIPVHLAVIPAFIDASLGKMNGVGTEIIPVTHGYAHKNHAAKPQKKCEFPQDRLMTEVEAELIAGQECLGDAFGEGFAPLFVPPWNRFAEKFNPILENCGYLGLSTFTPRRAKWASGGVAQVNTHVDPIAWHGSRSLLSPERIIEHTVASLKDRRIGAADNAEPFGFLTHHLVHDEAIWDFSREFLKRFAAGPTRMWTAYELRKG